MNETAAELLGSLLQFTQVFFELRKRREFEITRPICREPHAITICTALTKVFRGETKRLAINVEPRSGKTEFLINFIAWALAHYADCEFIYTSYAKTIAAEQTEKIRDMLSMLEYQSLFPNTRISDTSGAKDDFKTTAKGSVFAVGAGGSILGRGAGIKSVSDRFGGAIIIDDILKFDEAMSDAVRKDRIDWFANTLLSRRNNSDQTPIIMIGQRLHEDDLFGRLTTGKLDGYAWDTVILPSIDSDNNCLIPSNESAVRKLAKTHEYVFAAQYQQNPQPAGGGIFKKLDFRYLPRDPEMIATFITCDTAETANTANDPTVFSFFGAYRIVQSGIDVELLGLHSIDSIEVWVEPKDLEPTFLAFWSRCMQYPVKPIYVYPEKKSTGVTLASTLTRVQGLRVIPIERNCNSGNKTARFLAAQPYVAAGQVSFTSGAEHPILCVNHMSKITTNNSHLHDDICDTFADAIYIALVDKMLPAIGSNSMSKKLEYMAKNYN